jgi:hypothetical protein
MEGNRPGIGSERFIHIVISLSLVLVLLNSCRPKDNGSPSTSNIVTTSPSSTQTTTLPQTTTSPSSPIFQDTDMDNVSDEVEKTLIHRFAPVIKLHPNEQYLPAEIQWYLPRVRMRFDVSYGFDHQILDKGVLNIGNLLAQKDGDQVSGLTENSSNFFLEQIDVNGEDQLDSYRQETRKGSSSSDWTCYGHVRQAMGSDSYDVQYIFFYAYNGSLFEEIVDTAHEADFEHITVKVGKDLQTIVQIYYAAHDNEGKWYQKQTSAGVKDGYSLTLDGRPIVFAAINSHASYPYEGKWDRNNLPDDETSENGPVWDSINKVVNLGEKQHPAIGMQWVQYSGHWGEIGKVSWTTGPCGPAYQGWWNAD